MSLNESLEQVLSEVEMMKKMRTEERLKETRELKIQKEIELERFKQQLKEEVQEDEGGSQLEEVRVKVDEELTKLELKRRNKDRDRQRNYRKLQKLGLYQPKSEEEKIAEKRENQRIRSRKYRERKKCEDPEKLAELQARVYLLFYFYWLKI